jgi:hypothetical protein
MLGNNMAKEKKNDQKYKFEPQAQSQGWLEPLSSRRCKNYRQRFVSTTQVL